MVLVFLRENATVVGGHPKPMAEAAPRPSPDLPPRPPDRRLPSAETPAEGVLRGENKKTVKRWRGY